MKKEYRQALFEVYQILENSNEEIKNKIPKKFIDFLKENMDNDYKFKLEKGKELDKQNLMLETRQIIALIYRDYICDIDERNELLKKEKEKKEEKSKKININLEAINKQNKINLNKIENVKKHEKEEIALIEKKKKWYNKLIDKILKIFNINYKK